MAPLPPIYASECYQTVAPKPAFDASGKPDNAAVEALKRDWLEAAQTSWIKRLDAWGTNTADLFSKCSASVK